MTLLQLELWPRWLRDFLPLVVWMAVIFLLSAQPTLIKIEDEAGEKLVYKTAHMLAYAGLAWLWWRALAPQRQVSWRDLLLAFGLATLYGVTDEIHQRFVPGRHGRLADVFFDAAGAWAMILLIRQVKWLRTWPDSLLTRFSTAEAKSLTGR
ncbi:MAG: VanZ family protein [Anaerolineae bacterium]|nr:VanZ family protein [Anaerolineae bacterium]